MPRDPRRWSPRAGARPLLLEILKAANSGYPDGALANYFDEDTGELREGDGDGLARFVVIELVETHDPDKPDEENIRTAIEVMGSAMGELDGVFRALIEFGSRPGGPGR